MYFPILSADFVAVCCNRLILSFQSFRFERARARRRLALYRIQMMSEKYKQVKIEKKKWQRWWKMSELILFGETNNERATQKCCVCEGTRILFKHFVVGRKVWIMIVIRFSELFFIHLFRFSTPFSTMNFAGLYDLINWIYPSGVCCVVWYLDL